MDNNFNVNENLNSNTDIYDQTTVDSKSLMEQAEAYLLDCGLSEYQISSIRYIFLGE
jgi:hypothetical protein